MSEPDLDTTAASAIEEISVIEEHQEQQMTLIEYNQDDLPEVELDIDMIREGLGLLCKIGAGLQVAFVKLSITDKALTSISILESYKHLRYIDLSDNYLTDISPISNCLELLTLRCDNNKLPVIALGALKYLQLASFSHNNITSFLGISQMRLVELNLSYNWMERIMDINPGMLENLRILDLTYNRLKSINNLALYHLTHLYLANNQIKSLEGIELLNGLKVLHLRNNLIQNLDLKKIDPFDIDLPGIPDQNPNLEYLNLRSNKISNFSEIKKLQHLINLNILVLKDNPVQEILGESYKIEVLIVLRKLVKLDKMTYTDGEKVEAKRIEMERKARLEKQLFEDMLAEEEEDDEDDQQEQEQQEEGSELQEILQDQPQILAL